MITGKTASGFAFSVEEKALDDMELVEALAEVEQTPTALPKVLRLLLGEEQKRALYDFLRQKDGRVPVQAVTDAVLDIFHAGGPQAKN